MPPAVPPPLSNVDRLLCQHVADGDTYRQIGAHYGLSEVAVKDRVKQIRRRWQAKNATHLVSMLHRHRLIR